MTHSLQTEPDGKRERLIRSATLLMHQQGVDTPTLADIAHAAAVPPGNVYYHFKTRDELVDAVLATRIDGIRQLLAGLDESLGLGRSAACASRGLDGHSSRK